MKPIFLLILLLNFGLYGQENIDVEIKIDSIKNISKSSDFKSFEALEFEKFEKFKKGLDSTSSNNYLEKVRNYSKDSLKTLAIKLLSIRELQEKKLLRKDIKLNATYYINLLDDLKSSEISSDEYLFLEQELSSYSLQKERYRLKLSIGLNILFLTVLIFLIVTFYVKNRKTQKEILSRQEHKIRQCIIDGKSNKEIAEELYISLSTVKTHITNIYKKLNISNRTELFLKFKK